jgi:6-pyruvoyltetrahydropterin/6-carboxytetrahydropterin synthase
MEADEDPTKMMETFKQFTFEAAHKTPPFSGLHGHSFLVCLYLKGEPDPVYGWSHNLYEVETIVDQIKREVDHQYLNEINGLEVPTLENVARWLFNRFDGAVNGLDRLVIRRGTEGQAEGCTIGRSH